MENEGLLALEKLMTDYYGMCQDLGNNDDQYQRCNLTSERAIIEKELKAKANLVSMCENLAKLVGLKEKDCVELETIITNKLKALNEIVALYDKWLGNEMSDFEFFTLLNDIKYKYGLESEVLK